MQNPNFKNIFLVGLVAVVAMCAWVNWGDKDAVKNETVSEKCENYQKEFSSLTGVDFTASVNNFTDIENIHTVEPSCELKYENDIAEDDFQAKLSSKIFSYFTDNSWEQNKNAAAGGVDGEIYGFDKDGEGVIVSLHYTNKYDGCPEDEPVSYCDTRGKLAHHIALIQFGKPVPENVVSDIAMATYTNNKYGFSFSYPERYKLTLDPESSMSCIVATKDEKGISYGHLEGIDIAPGSDFPMSFLEAAPNIGEDPNVVLNGFLGYKLAPKCQIETIVFLRIYKKPVGVTTDAFLAKATKTENDAVAGGASGGYAELVRMDAGGKLVPVVHSSDGSVMANSSDTYYFEKDDYMYALNFSYSQSALGDPEISPDYAKQEMYKYNFAKNIVNNFSFTSSTDSGISGTVIDKSCGGAPMTDAYGNIVGPSCTESPFASFEIKIINDDTHVQKLVTADSIGKFRVELAPGNYTIKKSDKYGAALSGNDYHAEVKKDQFATVEMKFGYAYP